MIYSQTNSSTLEAAGTESDNSSFSIAAKTQTCSPTNSTFIVYKGPRSGWSWSQAVQFAQTSCKQQVMAMLRQSDLDDGSLLSVFKSCKQKYLWIGGWNGDSKGFVTI